MRFRLVILWIVLLLSGTWAVMTRLVTAIGASTVREDTPSFLGTLNNLGVSLISQPTWIPATIFLVSFGILLLWFFAPGMRAWLAPVNFDNVREGSVSFDWNGCFSQQQSAEGVIIFVQACRFINLSATQRRIIDIRFDIPLSKGGYIFLTSKTCSAPPPEGPMRDQDFAHRFRRTTTRLETPLTLEPGMMAEGMFGLLWSEKTVGSHAHVVNPMMQGAGGASLTVFEHRSGKQQTIKGGECYDARLQQRYRGAIGYPLKKPLFQRVIAAGRKRLSLLGIGRGTQR